MSDTVIRVSRRERYVTLDKRFLEDPRLGWRAKGILAYLLSKPNDWKVMMCDLLERSDDGRDSVYAGLKELEQHGYIERERLRGAGGKLGQVETIVYEWPEEDPQFPRKLEPSKPDRKRKSPHTAFQDMVAPHTDSPDTVKPDMVAPHTAKPDTVKPDTVNPLLLNNDLLNNDLLINDPTDPDQDLSARSNILTTEPQASLSSSEPEQVVLEIQQCQADSDPVVCSYRCNGVPNFWQLRQSQVDKWATAYEGLDILAEAKRAEAWICANPTKRKTAKGMPRFLVFWLGKANDRPKSTASFPQATNKYAYLKPWQVGRIDQFRQEMRLRKCDRYVHGKEDDPIMSELNEVYDEELALLKTAKGGTCLP
jgi:hypothetical protein